MSRVNFQTDYFVVEYVIFEASIEEEFWDIKKLKTVIVVYRPGSKTSEQVIANNNTYWRSPLRTA